MKLSISPTAPPADVSRTRRERLHSVAGLVCCVTSSVVAAACFLPHQSLWNDEATQMSGLRLSPIGVVLWLTNRIDHDFGVPDDRMPPISYWAGWAWSKAFGLEEVPLRWLGVACVAAATALVFDSARRGWGLASAWAAGLLFALSPNVAVQAVEIRAYPLLILASACIFACLVRFLIAEEPGRTRWLIGLTASGILATYTHFFGLVASGAAFLAALVMTRARRGRIGPVLVAGTVSGLAAMALIPFVFASVGISRSMGAGFREKVAGLGRLAGRLLAHPSMMLHRYVIAATIAGGVLALVGAIARRRTPVTGGLIVALASGATVVAGVHLAQSSFDAASPSYNAWMLPAVALLMASGLASASRTVRIGTALGVAMMIAADIDGIVQLAVHGDAFAHTPHRRIASIVRELGPDRVAIVHEHNSRERWQVYAPIRYEFGKTVPQYLYQGEGADGPRLSSYPDPAKGDEPESRLPEYVIVIQSDSIHAPELVRRLQGPPTAKADGPLAKEFSASERWERVREATFLAFIETHLDVFRRKDAGTIARTPLKEFTPR
ncbi:MAG: hypothetical protein JWN86_274 [Planctomycetota bacterium]|nr:hypothetical protein [Planctomycetota bacterium]